MPPPRPAARVTEPDLLPAAERGRVVLAGGLEIATLDWGGDGPLALLHHANGFCGALWAPIAERLRPHFRVVALDARGHGDSSAPPGDAAYGWSLLLDDLIGVAEALCGELGAPRVELGVGHSFGGTLTLCAAASRAGLYGRVVGVDPVLFPAMTPEQARSRAEESGLSERARKRRSRWPSRAEARAFFAEKPLFEAWEPRSLDLYVEEGLREVDGEVELKCAGEVEAAIFANGPGSLDPFEVLPGMKVPARLLWARGGNFPRELYETLAARMPAADVVDLDAGHLATMEDSELVATEILRFAGVG